MDEVSRALEYASHGSDIDALGFAMDQAFAVGTVSTESIQHAAHCKRTLEGEAVDAWRKKARLEAGQAIVVASSMGNVDMLASAIAKAEEAGLADQGELEAAKRQQTALESVQRRQKKYDQTLRHVRSAVRHRDADRVCSSILRALKAGANAATIKQAALAWEHRPARTNVAAYILQCASKGSSVDLLDLTLGWAMAEGVVEGSMAAARERLAVLAEVLAEDAQRDHALGEAARDLANAWQQDDPLVLEAALCRARAAGISEEMIHMAEKRRSKLPRREQSASLYPGEPGPAAGATLGGEVTIEDASRRQNACLEAARVLKEAMLQGSASGLEAAIAEAAHVGVSREIVARARRKLKRIQATERGDVKEELLFNVKAELHSVKEELGFKIG
mmetsp:Transcript_24802/g.48290  ORF Transcript_24802/g.48290 Transcript_24802/m.48290 type:complete len:391 (+) Transcript_24802:87-1259(+)